MQTTSNFDLSLGALSLIFMLLLVGCGQSAKEDNIQNDGLHVTVRKPVDRDFNKIKEAGTLRMITRYSSNSYFLQQGLEYGFEYELLKRFAKEQHLSLDVLVVQQGQNPYDMLNSGKGDVIADNYTITPARRRYVAFTRPYNLVDEVLVFSGDLSDPPQSLTSFIKRKIPVTVRSNSSYYHQLKKLREQGYALEINLVSNQKDTEALLFNVASGKYRATVADDNIFEATNKYMNGLVRGPIIARHDTIAWAVRKNAGVLKKKMNTFLKKKFRLGSAGDPPKRSQFLNILRKRYFEGGARIADYYDPESHATKSGVISPYDKLFKEVGDSAGIDWVMLAAITAQETRFNPKAKSWNGAMGLMQVLPRYSEVSDSTQLYNAKTNIREGVRILSEHLHHYAYLDSTTQWEFALAAYNVGQGHVADARRLAIDSNENPNEWEPAADALIKLMDRRYYRNARYGFCRGVQTVLYVQDIMNRYKTYRSILAIAQQNKSKTGKGVLGIFNEF